MTSNDLYIIEEELYCRNIQLIGGIDEAGRGCLAGPVVAACVILKAGVRFKYVDDSKKLNEKYRNLALLEIKENAISIGIAFVDNKEIDKINIYQASRLAMKQAVENMEIKPEYLLIDAMKININIDQMSIIKGDSKSISIAAASIIAKTSRDEYMKNMHSIYPCYNFKNNKGYGTKDHLKALNLYGVTDIHRLTYEPVKVAKNNQEPTIFDVWTNYVKKHKFEFIEKKDFKYIL